MKEESRREKKEWTLLADRQTAIRLALHSSLYLQSNGLLVIIGFVTLQKVHRGSIGG